MSQLFLGSTAITRLYLGETEIDRLYIGSELIYSAESAPDAFAPEGWTLENDDLSTINLVVSALPNERGSAITDIEYRVNEGTAVGLGETTTGTYPTTASQGDEVQIRAVNAIGAGDWSDTKLGPAPSPATLFTSGELGGYAEVSPSECWTDIARTTNATVGDPVASWRVRNPSGDLYFEQALVAARPILRQTGGGLYYLERDTTDDQMSFALQLNGSRWTAAMAYVPDGVNFIAVNNLGSANPWAGIGQAGSTSTAVTPSGITQNAIYFDNIADTSGTRGGQYPAGQSATRVAVDFTVATSWPAVGIGRYATGAFNSPGNIYGFFLIDRALTTQERSDLDDWLAARVAA